MALAAASAAAASRRLLSVATAKLTSYLQLRYQFAQFRNVVVALDHGRHRAKVRERRTIQIPNRLDDRMIVRVDETKRDIVVNRFDAVPHAV